jgi:hypothetical protein
MYRLEQYELELRSTAKGCEILEYLITHVAEVSRLINHNREVMVTWQRNKGAVFFADFMRTGFDADETMKKEIDGINLTSLIRRMAVVLQDHGSPELTKAIDQHLVLVLNYAEEVGSLKQVFQTLRAL